jgi:hypothetical protein
MLRVLQSPYIRALKFIHKIPIVNNMKGRVTLIALLLTLTSAVSASAASGSVRLSAHSYCGSRCGQVAAIHGAGTLQQWGTGVTYGTVGQGTIAIRDRSNNGHRDFSVGGWERKWTKNGFVYYSGKGMSYLASTTWTVKITASWGASTTTTAVGRGYIRGATKNNAWLDTHWTLGSGLSPSQWPHWPTAGKSFAISR